MQIKTVPCEDYRAIYPQSDIDSIVYRGKELAITIACFTLGSGERQGVRVHFPYSNAFRCLDEGELARYWTSPDFCFGYHVVKVLGGGWCDENAIAKGYESQRTEWMIVTGNDCVNVFSEDAPEIEDIVLPKL